MIRTLRFLRDLAIMVILFPAVLILCGLPGQELDVWVQEADR